MKKVYMYLEDGAIDKADIKSMLTDAPDSHSDTPPATPPPVTPPPAEPPAQDSFEIPDDVLGDVKKDAPVVQPPAQDMSDADLGKLDEKVRSSFIRQRQEIAELKKKMTGAPANPEQVTQLNARVEELNKQVNEYQNQIGMMNLEKDPRFKAKYELPKAQLIESISQFIKGNDYEANIEALLNMNLKERNKKLSEDMPDIAPTVNAMLLQADQINRMRSKELEDHKNRVGEFETMKQKQIGEIQQKLHTTAIDNAVRNGLFLFKESKNEEWNKTVNLLRETSMKVLTSQKPDDLANAVVAGTAMPLMLKLFARTMEENKTLKDQLGKVVKSSPKVKVGQDVKDGSTRKPATADTFVDRVIAKQSK